ncbi:extracellular solute-binding protein [Litoreibacter sp.]|nr:extracellular solute-binding protein [Litoreibacter sp.]
MFANAKPRPKLTRRNMMSGSLALSAYMCTPFSAEAMALEGFSKTVAEKARKLADGRPVELRFLIPDGSQDNVAPVMAAFTEQTGVQIKPERIALEDINTHLILNSFAGDAPYDVALPATFGMPDLVDAGVLRPLGDFARIHEPDELRSGILYDVGDGYDDEIYGFQTDGDTYLMFYNSDLLNDSELRNRYADQTGKMLGIPDTWQELDRQLAFFHRPDQGVYGGALFRISGYLAWEWWVRFHAKGIWPFSLEMEPQIASDQGVEALTEMIEATQYLVPEAHTQGLFQNWERFGRGDVYCNIGWGGTQKYLNGASSNVRGKLAYGPTPGGIVNGEILKTPYFNWGWDYVVTQKSQEPEISYLFALFASSPDISVSAIRPQGGYFDPYRVEHYADPEIRRVYSDEFLSVHRESLLSSIPDLYLANQSEYFSVLNSWLDAALNQEITPREALKQVEREWSLITIRADGASQRKRWAGLRERYPPNARRLLRDL